MKALLELPCAMYELFRLGVLTRFDFRGPYWSWRMNTAFGRGMPSRGQMLASILEYARWTSRMRRGL